MDIPSWQEEVDAIVQQPHPGSAILAELDTRDKRIKELESDRTELAKYKQMLATSNYLRHMYVEKLGLERETLLAELDALRKEKADGLRSYKEARDE